MPLNNPLESQVEGAPVVGIAAQPNSVVNADAAYHNNRDSSVAPLN